MVIGLIGVNQAVCRLVKVSATSTACNYFTTSIGPICLWIYYEVSHPSQISNNSRLLCRVRPNEPLYFLIALFVLRACRQSSRVLSKDHSQKASQLFQGTRAGLSDESKKGAKFENLYFCCRNFRFSCKYGIFKHSEYRVTILNRLKNLCARWKWDLTEIRAFLENRKKKSWRSFFPRLFFLCLPSRLFFIWD